MAIENIQSHENTTIMTGSFSAEKNKFLRLSENPVYTKEVCTSIDDAMTMLASFPDKTDNGLLLAGSFARYLSGNGDTKTNWQIREKALEMQEKFIHDPQNKSDFKRISRADQDIDTAFVFKNEGSLATLYAFIKSNAPNATETITTLQTPEGLPIQTTHLDFVDAHKTGIHLEFGPISTNPNLIHMTMGFHNNNERVFHIDIAKFPSDGMQTLDQKRIGGSTNEAQDIYIPITLDEQGKLIYKIQSNDAYSVLHKESVNVEERKAKDVVELSIRALRIHLIHSEYLFTDTSLKSLTALFYTEGKGNIFDIRKTIQSLIRSGETIPKEQMDLFRTELLICMANDPYETAKFLQDTGIYLLIPGLKNFNHHDWKNFFTSTALTFLQEGTPITPKEMRSIEGVQYSHGEFKKVKWNEGVNGMQRFIRAYGEVMKSKLPDLDLKNYDQMYSLLFKTESKKLLLSEKQQATSLPNMLLFLFRTYPSGVTEREMQGYLQTMTNQEISREIFQKALFQIKTKGLIDRQTRMTPDGSKVVFYSPRLTADGSLNVTTTPLTNNEIHTALIGIQYIDQSAIHTLEHLLLQLPCRSIESFRPLRSYERELLATEMHTQLLESGNTTISKDTVLNFIMEVQQACVGYSKKRGL